MLIGNASNRPNLNTVRRIKRALFEVLQLSEEAMITVTQLACMEEACAPFETVIGLLRPGAPQLQYKVHKAIEDINAQDLVRACNSWGFDVQNSALKQLLISNQLSRR